MARKNQSIEAYVVDAKALAKRGFPAAKKYVRRKTLKPAEKAAIARMREAALAGKIPKPKKSDSDYRKIAREASKYVEGLKGLGRGKLSPQKKARITRLAKEARAAKFATKLTPQQFKNIPRKARFSKNTKAIKLRETIADSNWRVTRVNKDGSINALSNNRKWRLEPVRITGEIDADAERLIMAGNNAFDLGAKQVNMWFWNGIANAGYRDRTKWAEYVLAYLAQYDDSPKFIVGIAYTGHK